MLRNTGTPSIVFFKPNGWGCPYFMEPTFSDCKHFIIKLFFKDVPFLFVTFKIHLDQKLKSARLFLTHG